jgi:ABC-type Fe3+ transport system permease subunit
MLVSRWMRTLARFGLGVILIAPAVALPATVLWDRGPAGDVRVSHHFFPVALWLFDDFAWTCARNSIIFAVAVSIMSLVVGGLLGWMVARHRFWGRGLLHGLVVASLAVSPAYLALGLGGLFGWPRQWPWPVSANTDGAPGVSLESWAGLPLWVVWVWTTLPWGVALVASVTAAAVETLEPSWEDAARLTGVGRLRAWRTLLWPLVRPSSARAAALVFVFALAEPGAALVLGLRRTLAFQIVQSVGRPDPFPGAAVWAVMTGLFGFAGWIIWRWAGGGRNVLCRRTAPAGARSPRSQSKSSLVRALALTILFSGWAVIGWLPIVGLVKLAGGATLDVLPLTGGALQMIEAQVRRLSDPSVLQLLANSLLLGVEIACATVAVAWLAGTRATDQNNQPVGTRLARLLECAPPLLAGVGLLAISWLAGLGSASLADMSGWRQLAIGLESISARLDASRNPWIAMSCSVALSLVPRFVRFWPREAHSDRSWSSAQQAALLAGASRGRAVRLGRQLARGRWLAGAILVGSLAATNLTPALLFERWSDGQTLAPAIVRTAVASAADLSLAAALALCAITINMVALGIAWVSSALPRTLDLD